MNKKTVIKDTASPNKKNTIKYKRVTSKQIELLKSNKMPFAAALGLIAGIGSQYAFLKATDKIVETDEVDETENEEKFDFQVPTNIEFSDVVNDDMSFGEAFSAARADTDGSGFFNWRGNTYHTLYKEEWDALSDDEKQEFYDKIKENADFDKGESNKIDTDETDKEIEEEEEKEDNKEDNKEDEKEEEEKEEEDEKKEDNEDNEEDKEDKEDEAEGADEAEIPDEISFDDIIYEDEDYDTNEKLEDFVTVDEIGETVDIIDGLNDGEATGEAEGIIGGADYVESDFDNDTDPDVEYDEDFGDDLIS